MAIQFDSVIKVYKDRPEMYGVEVYDSFNGNETFIPLDDNTLVGLDILTAISNMEDLNAEEILIKILEKVEDGQYHIFIDNEYLEYNQIKSIVRTILENAK